MSLSMVIYVELLSEDLLFLSFDTSASGGLLLQCFDDPRVLLNLIEWHSLFWIDDQKLQH